MNVKNRLNLGMSLILVSCFAAYAVIPLAVPTFNCLGLCWKTADGSATNLCKVQYREQGTGTWNNALDLWYDSRNSATMPGLNYVYAGGYINTYRGSIVNLKSGTTYEVKLNLQTSLKETTFTATTWSEYPPIAKVIELNENYTDSVSLSESGTAAGYVMYTHPAGAATTTIDVNNTKIMCLMVKASYIIIKGLTLKGAQMHGMELWGSVHDIIIEECDISGWGRG